MTISKIITLTMAAAIVATSAFAQDTKEEKLKEKGDLHKLNEGWTKKAGLGLGLDQTAIINPRLGAGNEQIGVRGILSGSATYRMGRMAWDNVGVMQYGIQKIGSLGVNLNEVPFTKSVDNLQLGSKFGYGIAENSPFYYSVASTFRSQLSATYVGNTLTPIAGLEGSSIYPISSDFFSPALFTLAPGIDYKPTENFSVMFSPATLRMLFVMNENIAKTGVMGNKVTKNEAGMVTDPGKITTQLGASLAISYKESFFNKKINFQTGLNLFSNYLNKPQNIIVDWGTTTKFNIFKGWGIALNTNLWYDDNVDVIKKDKDALGTPALGLPAGYRLGKGTQFVEGLFVTYDRTF